MESVVDMVDINYTKHVNTQLTKSRVS